MCGKLSSSSRLTATWLHVHVKARGHREVFERRVVGMEGERDEGLEAAGLVLHLRAA
jgi:hypothetical protein